MVTKPNAANANGHRRRQLAQRIKATSTHCALCDQPLNPNATWPAPDSTVIDENIPRAKGGSPLDPDNTNAMHAACNRWKSTMTLAEARKLLAKGVKIGQHLAPKEREKLLNPKLGKWEPAATCY